MVSEHTDYILSDVEREMRELQDGDIAEVCFSRDVGRILILGGILAIWSICTDNVGVDSINDNR